MQRVAAQVQPPQAGRANRQAHAANAAQQFGQAGQVVRGGHVQQVVVQRGHAGGGKAQHEAVEREVVHAPARQGVCVVLVVATVAMAAVQVLEAQHGVSGLGRGGRAQRRTAGGGRHIAPEAAHAQAQRQHGKQEHGRKQAHQQVVREDAVEAAHRRLPQRANALPVQRHGQQQEQREPRHQRQRQGQAVALVELAQRGRPGVVGIGLAAHLGHGLGHVHGKLVRRCVLAGVQAGAAVVAQVGDEMDVGLAELQPPRHGGEHGAKAFAVAAGIADLELAGHFGLGGGEHDLAIGQRLGVARQGFKRLHGSLLFL